MQEKVKCPSCGTEFEFNMEKAVEDKVRQEFNQQFSEQRNQLEKQAAIKLQEIEAERKKLDELKLNESVRLQKKLAEEKIKQQKEIEENVKAENDLKLKSLEEENAKKGEQLKVAMAKELELIKKGRELEEKQQMMELEVQRKMEEERKTIEENARKKEEEKQHNKFQEKEQLIHSLQKNIDDLNRKIEQGSMQLQGETQELALENLLKSTFPFDIIDEVGKGVRGADCMQTVRNNTSKICGKIIYESKRTKDFKQEWIEKLKADMRNAKADVAVIVTETMPKDMLQFGLKEEVWICTFKEVSALATVLRDGILKIDQAKASQENKGDKMHLLYDYLTGNEFTQQVSAIVQGFTSLQSALSNEKKAMEKIWAVREKQIDMVMQNTIKMYGSVKGIAGTSIKEIAALELGNDEQLALE